MAIPSDTKNVRACDPTWLAVGLNVKRPVVESNCASEGSGTVNAPNDNRSPSASVASNCTTISEPKVNVISPTGVNTGAELRGAAV